MTFFKIGDEATGNAKIQGLLRAAMDNSPHGPAAFGMWAAAGSAALAKGSDGVVTEADLVALFLNRRLVKRWAGLLVEAGLWHGHGHGCERCPEVDPGAWLFHDWFSGAMNYPTGEQQRASRRQAYERASRALQEQVWSRDCADDPSAPKMGLCRYCGHEVRRADRKSPRRPHIDHVDPNLAVGLRNLVLCCAVCNQKKGARTPEEAGMELRPEPDRPQQRRGISGANDADRSVSGSTSESGDFK